MRAVEQSALPRRERAVARAFAFYVRDDAPAMPIYPGLRRLVQRTGYSQRSIQRAIAVLEGLGILTPLLRMANRPTRYVFEAAALPGPGVAQQLVLFRPRVTNWPLRPGSFAQADRANQAGKPPVPQDAQASTGQIVGVGRQIGQRS